MFPQPQPTIPMTNPQPIYTNPNPSYYLNTSLLQPQPIRVHPLLDPEKFFQLTPDNNLRHCRLEQMSEEIKKRFYDIELRIDNTINLKNHVHANMKEMSLEPLKRFSRECLGMAGSVSSKQQIIKGLIEGLISDNHNNIDMYDQAHRQWQLLKTTPSATIEIPSIFFSNLEAQFEQRLKKHSMRIAELDELLTVQMQAKEADLEETPDLLFELLTNMNDNLSLIAAILYEIKETLGEMKLRFIQIAKEKTGRSEVDLSNMFKLPTNEFPEISELGVKKEYEKYGKMPGLGEKTLTDQDKFYKALLSGPSSSISSRKFL